MADNNQVQDYYYPNIEPIDYIDESLEKILARDDSAKHGFRRTQTFPIVTADDIGMEVYLIGVGKFKLIAFDAGEPTWKQLTADNRNPAYTDWVEENYQPISNVLKSLAKLTNVSNSIIYFTGPENVQASPVTTQALTFLSKNSAANMRSYLGLGTMATQSSPISGTLIQPGTIPISAIDNNFANNMGFSTGDVKLTYKASPDSGWVMADDGSIGNAGSGATNRANADTEALFKLMWRISACTLQTYAGSSTSKTTAAQDWSANKRLILPKLLGRALGVAGAGSGLTNRAIGASTGAETVTLTVNQMPSHSHSLQGKVPVYSDTKTGNYTFHRDGQYLYKKGEEPSAVVGETGGGQAHNNMQPSSFLNLMIKL